MLCEATTMSSQQASLSSLINAEIQMRAGLKKVDRFYTALQQVDEVIFTADMGQFVKQYGFYLVRRQLQRSFPGNKDNRFLSSRLKRVL